MWVIYLLLGLVILLVLTLVVIGIKYIRDYWHFLGVPHDHPRPLSEIVKTYTKYGTCQQLLEQHEYFRKLYKKFKSTGPFCGYYHQFDPRVLVLGQELMQQILVKNFSNFNDRGCYHNMKHDPLSADLFSSSGAQWKEMRLKLEPVFQKAYMAHFFESIREECEKFLMLFELARQDKQQSSPSTDVMLNVQPLMHRYVLGNIGRCVFGLNNTLQIKYSLEEFDEMTQFALHTQRHGNFVSSLMEHYPNLFRHLKFATTKENVQMYFINLLRDVIEHRAKVEAYTDDYLQLLINLMNQEWSTHETDLHKSASELKEHLLYELAAHAFTFLRAGLEPTEKTLTYALYELARDPVMQQKVREEVTKVYEQHDERFTHEGIQSLKYMGQFISETLRIHPITPFIMRRTLTDYVVSSDQPNYLIRKNTFVVIPVHAIHNDPEIYPQPHIFNPDRFAGEDNRRRQSCTWLGFGEGPRNCLGVHFAQLQMRSVLAHLLMRYEFSLDGEHVMIMCCQEDLALRIKPLSERREYVETEGRESAIVI